MALVDYDSSDSSSEDDRPRQTIHHARAVITQAASSSGSGPLRRARKSSDDSGADDRPDTKRPRKLPSLPSSFALGPKDDPTLHQGRTRTRPYVDGDYNAHVYLSLTLPSALRTILEEYLVALRLLLKDHAIHSSLESLHISLTHPLPLRRHQIIPFREKLWAQLRTHGSFRLSLVGDAKVYYNRSQMQTQAAENKDDDDAGHASGGRAFFALRTGAGSVELKAMLDNIFHPILETMHLPTYHANPEFHTSFGWCLLNPHLPAHDQVISTSKASATDGSDQPRPKEEEDHMTRLSLRDVELAEFNARFREKILRSQPKGGWQVDSVKFKAGKEVTTLTLV
ncbi:hypothetical protein I316_05955 [Kwoniella heveanensis BCC8398]|uniref:U6 snRNA phosphodiesterase 1 n=1 Tax=Kwoniella heveanensis BCC8398 TaxID=1296120 RepID=A0A1B9GMQ9_9TREE|nr:hypothetical protein I316_05955 [Kwoniella heveanensis BCC8398]